MKVVLKQDIKGTGKKDQVVEVSDGYARNFLFPRKLAAQADNTAMNDVKNKNAAKEHHLEMEKQAAQELCDKINTQEVVIKAKAGSNGKLFGAVTSKDIALALNNKFGINVDKRKVALDADIKVFGIFKVKVKVYPKITAEITVNVEE